MTEPTSRDRAKRIVLAYWAGDDFSKLEDIAYKNLEAAREDGRREGYAQGVAGQRVGRTTADPADES